MASEVYIGLVGVAPNPGSDVLGTAKGAYVNVLVLASSVEEYEAGASRALADLGLFAFEFEDVEPFESRANHRDLEEELHVLASEVSESKKPRFSNFHTFASTDA